MSGEREAFEYNQSETSCRGLFAMGRSQNSYERQFRRCVRHRSCNYICVQRAIGLIEKKGKRSKT